MTTYDELLAAMLMNPPDPEEPLPLSNRKETIFGTTLTFMLVSWIAVLFRLWVRIRVVREAGWDDAFVLVAALCNTTANIFVCLAVDAGLGRHMLYIGVANIERYLMRFYVAHAIYLSTTAIIKISLLLQYIRIFKAGALRWICLILIVLVSLWGISFSIVGWFPCIPVRGFWDRTINAKCYGFGLSRLRTFIHMFEAHSSLNMTFDVIIFFLPMVLFATPDLKWGSALAMAGLFTFGGLVVAISIWRIYGIVTTGVGTYPYIDFTWWLPTLIIISCLEIDIAIICASMPIFWPVLQKSIAAIFVSYEVQIVEERISDHGLVYELEHRSTGKDRAESVRSSGTSTKALTHEGGILRTGRPEHMLGFDPVNDEARVGGFRTDIESRPKPKWEL